MAYCGSIIESYKCRTGLQLACNLGSYEDVNTFEKTSCIGLSFELVRVQHQDYEYVLLMEVSQYMHNNVQGSTCKCHFPCVLTRYLLAIAVITCLKTFS